MSLVVQNLGGTAGAYATYDLTGGQVLAGGTGGANVFGAVYLGVGTDVVNVANGWWRIGLSFTSDAATAFQLIATVDNGQGQSARSVSFAGATNKGIWLWKCNMLPTAAWNHTALAFDTEFTNPTNATLDLQNTKAAGFQFYLGGPWPNSTNYTNVTQAWRIAAQQVAGNLSFGADGLSITGLSTVGQDISTVAYTSGSSYVGTALTPAGLWCAGLKFDKANSISGQVTWPAFWSIAVEFLTGSASHFVEADHIEINPPASGSGTVINTWGTLDWTIAALNISQSHYQPTISGATQGNEDNAAHRYCDLWIVSTENGGIGYKQRYFDNNYLGSIDLTYSSGSTSIPASSPNTSGDYFVAESQHFPVLLSAWVGLPAIWQYVRIWQ